MLHVSSQDGFYLVQDEETGKFFVWRYATRTAALDACNELSRQWIINSLERAKDLVVNFVDEVESTLFQK